jgi:WD40 repeat protein
VFSVSFSPDGKTIASASGDKSIQLWTKQGKPLQTLTGHDQQVNSVSFSPDGKSIASASDDKTVIVWNLADIQLNKLMRDACDRVGDYLKYNAEESDRHLCDGIGEK